MEASSIFAGALVSLSLHLLDGDGKTSCNGNIVKVTKGLTEKTGHCPPVNGLAT